MIDAPFAKFRSFYDSLVRSATVKGVPITDAQDLAGDAIERALAGFDPAKGEFSAFCYFILSNIVKNYWRDKKKTEQYPDEEGPMDPDSMINSFELAETLHEIHRVLADLKKSLSPEENVFLKHLQDVLDESGPRAISEAARRSGLTPAKGWDLFRAIRRKARKIDLGTIAEADMIRLPAPPVYEVDRVSGRFDSRFDPFQKLLARFSPVQLKKIESLLS